MQTDAHNMGREERRALLEQRRAAVARQLRRLAIELTVAGAAKKRNVGCTRQRSCEDGHPDSRSSWAASHARGSSAQRTGHGVDAMRCRGQDQLEHR